MYISRVEIDRNNRRKIKDLRNIESYHGWVEQSFPDEIKQEIRTRKLWRIDQLQGKQYLIIVSQEKPNLKQLEKYGVKNSAQTKDYDHFLNSLKEGERMRFRLVLNPVISRTSKDNNHKRGVLMPHVTVKHQMEYLMNRSMKNGFALRDDDFSIVERGYEVFNKTHSKSIRLIKAVYEGILIVNDVELFKKVLTEGIGKKKAYGFGLMTVIPVGD
ncbi:type I-E CRISPR-associated protein Cas6/Cse3/CasE [Streptococcus chenjunshii]|uniref:Type I-E CRISPR-associated protein Cas6/Cse3/CasE n=1 Tax=Streptococcus chenjunshii TaxID=2173853 RepID=A0A372KQT1_9STRE|nr:type I-E CRISPR-associated protein Cas6/Cse3/CasE [Streptococcus chenjunshii]AXQ78447.1 type I-E CRISPR-associated protein Cas6/Cse3/CasE [Streptococcus chenjunshii]RFU52092.1 type I-E CRISPR-associated protein Cas6/Cse3/CasE [Streptococcus chenjunshii]RFU54284.1 type I-E CRISPR-associated protein Cas6/Cse3/CasE [Streptococcus chenjunshii]